MKHVIAIYQEKHIARHNNTPNHINNEKILSGEIEKSDEKKDLKCYSCDVTYNSVSSFNRHLKSKKHKDNKDFNTSS